MTQGRDSFGQERSTRAPVGDECVVGHVLRVHKGKPAVAMGEREAIPHVITHVLAGIRKLDNTSES